MILKAKTIEQTDQQTCRDFKAEVEIQLILTRGYFKKFMEKMF